MTDIWTSIYKGTIEHHPVEIEIYSGGGYRVHTTQNEDNPGTIEIDDTSVLINPPTGQGTKITIEGETADEIRIELLTEGFSDAATSEIVGKISA
ncbi:hypothetical protein [Aeromonas veronii]|uniref:hypothetical protein n=1 Tax=Aeromonas veronii TaxID=654 RepID=UPI0022480943|nr:hypothetical protein [Aeromonas veronii]MCX0444403.1 hypothetical protein [Aeromonas veronii]